MFPDGGRRCHTHASTEDLRLIDELDAMAEAADIGLRRQRPADWDSRFAWGYGYNINLAARARLIGWALENRVRLADRGHRCVRWLREGACRSSRCQWSLPSAWLDHTLAFTRAGAPAAVIACPYHLGAPDVDELAALDADPALRVELLSEGSLYGYGTWQVNVWRAAS